jgi:hypothetical protein
MDKTKEEHKHEWKTRYVTFEYRYECASGMVCDCGEIIEQDEVEALLNDR